MELRRPSAAGAANSPWWSVKRGERDPVAIVRRRPADVLDGSRRPRRQTVDSVGDGAPLEQSRRRFADRSTRACAMMLLTERNQPERPAMYCRLDPGPASCMPGTPGSIPWRVRGGTVTWESVQRRRQEL
jgi:hypothetical protein